MGCSCSHNKQDRIKKEFTLRSAIEEYWKPLFSLLMLISGSVMTWLDVCMFKQGYLLLAWYVIAYLPVGLPVLKESWKHICRKDIFNEFTLMSLAAIGAFYIGEYPEAVSVMLFYFIGELFQEQAVCKAKRHIGTLLDIRPDTASVVKDDTLIIIHPSKVQIGEIIEVKAGERVPLDGIMLEEMAVFNTAALTGESMPRTIRRGEDVLSGMIPSDRMTQIEITKSYEKSTLVRILNLIQSATEHKAPAEKFITKFSRIYTPIVIGIATLVVLIPYIWSFISPTFVFEFNDWLYRALVFLVVSCPCALVISIPLGYFGGIGAASKLGILFKGGNYLDAITKVNTMIFDKTGTLTKGVFEVQTVQPVDSLTETSLISWVSSVEKNSTHPIAKAIVQYAEQQNILFEVTEKNIEIAGYGLKAELKGKEILVGNPRLLSKYQITFPSSLNLQSNTLVVCAIDRIYMGCISLSDTLKDDALTAIKDLKALNIENIQVLSGDKQDIVTKFAGELGIHQAYGDLLPEDKVSHLNELRKDRKNKIAFIGDGMNDAPVLALSDVGIAMGGIGSDIAIETADVIIQTDQPTKVATAIRIGKYTHRIIWQNIFLALSVKLLIMILGAGGLATLWEAVFADVGVALLAILNAMRIGKILK